MKAAPWLLLFGLAAASGGASPGDDGPDPRDVLRRVAGFSEPQIAAVERGEVVSRQLPTADKSEMAAFGAVCIRASQDVFLEKLRSIVRFRQGASILEIGGLRRPPSSEDLQGLTLEEGDLEAVRKCHRGGCDLKMSSSAIDRIQGEIDWKAADAKARATALARRMLAEYAAAYMEGGTAAMATYNDKETPQETAAEFRKLLAASPYLALYIPEFHRYVEAYPNGTLAGTQDLFYWSKEKFGPKPTILLHHVTIFENPKRKGQALVSTKQIYASHYFRAGLDLTALVDAPGSGFYLMDLYRTRIDPPTGMLSGVILGKIRAGVEQGVAESLRVAKARAEAN
jgi:hypothetical protein